MEEVRARLNERLARLGAGPVELVAAEPPEHLAAAAEHRQRLVPTYGQALVEQAEREPRLVALDADLRKDTGLVEFRERFPERFFECGIAEQDMVSQAGAMALAGLLPVVHSFACFLSTRPNEQIYNNATEGTKVIYAGSLAGLVPGRPGPLAPVGTRHIGPRRRPRNGADRALLGARGPRGRRLGRERALRPPSTSAS